MEVALLESAEMPQKGDITMSKQITYHFGTTRDKTFPEFPIGNVLVCGGTHTTWWTVIRNLLSEQILQYSAHDLTLRIFDSKSADLCPDDRGDYIGLCDICEACTNATEDNVNNFLCHVQQEVHRRLQVINGSDKTTYAQFNEMNEDPEGHISTMIVVLHNLGYTVDSMDEDTVKATRSHLQFIMTNAERSGVYVLMTCNSDPKFVLRPLKMFVNNFDMVALTSVSGEQSVYALGNDIAMFMSDSQVAVRDTDGDVRVLNVPNYYDENVIKSIQEQELFPKGVKFEENKLKQWALFMGANSDTDKAETQEEIER